MTAPRYWAIVPAAGVGRRFGAHIPKQYLPLRGRPVLQHTLERLAALPGLEGVVVAIGAADRWWADLQLALPCPLEVVPGGAERVDSVLRAARHLAPWLGEGDWLLVHDAARPCVRPDDILRLMDAVRDHPCGGLLGTPVRDTMKDVDADGTVRATVDRSRLWHAYTPQLFRAPLLLAALEVAVAEGRPVTDEASAMEAAGHAPRMVEGHADNLKITRREDLALAEFFLARQAAEGAA